MSGRAARYASAVDRQASPPPRALPRLARHVRFAGAVAIAAVLALGAATRDGAGEEQPFEGFVPFPAGTTYRCDQGIKQAPSHNDDANRYAIDFNMPKGSPVCAIADGVVAYVKQDTAGPTGRAQDNNYIGINHAGGTASTYEHIQKDSARVKPGDRVVAGDVICLSGDTGWAGGPHLHFTCRAGSHRSSSTPSRFREVPGDGVPTTGAMITSRNFEIRRTAWWRTARQAADQFVVCEGTDTDGLALAAVESARKLLAEERHPSAATILTDLRLLERPRSRKSDAATAALARARTAKDLDVLATLAAFGPADFADTPELAKECAAIAAEFGSDPGWQAADEALADVRAFRGLVGAALAAEDAALALFVSPPPEKPDPKGKGKPAPKPTPKPKPPSKPPAKPGPSAPSATQPAPPAPAEPVLLPGIPDYAAAVAAWEKARACSPDERASKAIEARIEELRTAR